jgi:transposase InsO family protein
MLGISTSTTTSFHPQSNGMVERFHRSLKSSLRARLAGSDWFSHLPLVLLGLRATPKDDTGLSVSEAVYSSPLTLPGELVDVPELLPDTFLRKVDRAIEGFAVSPPHHVRPAQPVQLPAALVSAKYIFVREDAVI